MGGAKGFGDMTGQRFGMKDGEGNVNIVNPSWYESTGI